MGSTMSEEKEQEGKGNEGDGDGDKEEVSRRGREDRDEGGGVDGGRVRSEEERWEIVGVNVG